MIELKSTRPSRNNGNGNRDIQPCVNIGGKGAVPDVYPYEYTFQTKVLILMLREPTFLPSYNDIIRPAYFDSPVHARLVRMVGNFFEKHHQVPDHEALNTMIVDEDLEQEALRDVHAVIDDVYRQSLSEALYVGERVVEFGKSKLMEGVALDLADMVHQGIPADVMWEKIDRYRKMGSSSGTPGMDIAEEFLHADEVCKDSSLFNPALKIGTMFPSLDAAFYGGLGRRELGVILGYTGHGKSAMLVNLGTAAIKARLPVVHVSVGELEVEDLLARYSSCWTQMSINDIMRGLPEYKEAALDFYNMYKPKIRGKYFPSYTTVSSIRSYLSRCKYHEGLNPALVIIDNADDLNSGRRLTGDLYEELGEVYIQLKQLAHDFDVAMWTDSQTNRSGKEAFLIDTDSMSDSHKKSRKADVVVSVNRDKKDEGILKLFVAKARRYKKQEAIYCRALLDRMTIIEDQSLKPAKKSQNGQQEKPESPSQPDKVQYSTSVIPAKPKPPATLVQGNIPPPPPGVAVCAQ